MKISMSHAESGTIMTFVPETKFDKVVSHAILGQRIVPQISMLDQSWSSGDTENGFVITIEESAW